MIKPVDNLRVIVAVSNGYVFPPIRFLRCSLLARKCAALIRGDRYLTERDKVKA